MGNAGDINIELEIATDPNFAAIIQRRCTRLPKTGEIVPTVERRGQ
jgi:hypothetical protein